MKDEEEKVYVPREEDYSPELFETNGNGGFNFGLQLT
jgi:hypothetical protein